MSSISFKSETNEALVGGRERAHMGCLVRDFASAMAGLEKRVQYASEHMRARLLAALNCSDERWVQYILHSSDDTKTLMGRQWNIFTLALNTVLRCGSDEMRLLARIHGQCELHGFVEGCDRAWLAALIDSALAIGVMREETQGYGNGWRDVVALLRESADGPVVMSYSVCDSFPPYRREDEEGNQADDERSDAQRWADGMASLREQPLMRMQPSDWATYYCDDGETVFDFMRALNEHVGAPGGIEPRTLA